MSTPTLQKHFLRILRTWPTDSLRGLTLQYSIPRRLALRSGVLPPSSAATKGKEIRPATSAATVVSSSPSPSPSSTSSSTLSTTTPATSSTDENASINALYSLIENRYLAHYPTSERMLRPGFKADYYADLARELDEAPKRTWLQRKWLRWSKLVRFS